MPEIVTLELPEPSERQTYQIIIGESIISDLANYIDLSRYSRIHVLYDEGVKDKLACFTQNGPFPSFTSSSVTSGESAKTLSTLEHVLRSFSDAHLDRRSLVVNLGGGMLGDLGGFAASIYMRGIDFIQIPTTLLAQVDASVGGKVAVNFEGIKNLIGSFQQPKVVLIDVETLSTLPKRELYAGFAEIIKHAIISDREFISVLESQQIASLNNPALISLIKRSCEIKANVVRQDPNEKGLRKILNFGHTIGHAIEATAAKGREPLLHGECVALGMIAEAMIMHRRGKLSAADISRIESLLLKFNLPIRLANDINLEMAMRIISYDKKNSAGTILCALVEELGSCNPVVSITTQEAQEAIESLKVHL